MRISLKSPEALKRFFDGVSLEEKTQEKNKINLQLEELDKKESDNNQTISYLNTCFDFLNTLPIDHQTETIRNVKAKLENEVFNLTTMNNYYIMNDRIALTKRKLNLTYVLEDPLTHIAIVPVAKSPVAKSPVNDRPMTPQQIISPVGFAEKTKVKKLYRNRETSYRPM